LSVVINGKDSAFFYKEVDIMTGINEIAAYTQASQTYNTSKSQSEKSASSATSTSSKVDAKKWSPIDASSSLVPTKTEYGYTIGNVKLSENAAKYYEKLKAKYHNMEFIAVSSDVKNQVQANAASYGNASKMVVLLDAEKIEKMASDENFRKKYEAILDSAQTKMAQAKSSFASSGASVSNFGMSVDSNGNEKFFATVKKSLDMQKERIEKNAEKKQEEKVKEKKKAEKEATEERFDKIKEKFEVEDYEIIQADSIESLISNVAAYSYNNTFVMTEAEMALGNSIDFKG